MTFEILFNIFYPPSGKITHLRQNAMKTLLYPDTQVGFSW